jgi:dTDP-4-dehydrorhamnose 3,5-epimerase
VRTELLDIPGCVVLHLDRQDDERGTFVKPFQRSLYEGLGMDADVAEFYWSTSGQGVIRGLHFQLPPHAHAKTVAILAGSIADVVLDLRADSPTFRQHRLLTLDSQTPAAVHVPTGCAHGFQALSASATVGYLVGTEYAPEHDAGVRWDSAGIAWPLDPTAVSERDASFPGLGEFVTPFTLQGAA